MKFLDDVENLIAFVKWLREEADIRGNPRMQVFVHGKHEDVTFEEAVRNDRVQTWFLDSLPFELEQALEALVKIRAAAALRHDLKADDMEELFQ